MKILGIFDHPYPATKLMWCPDKIGNLPDLVATSGDYLRLWKVDNDKKIIELNHIFNNVNNSYEMFNLTFKE